jgi:CRP/FNR family cyclic AMP-dependent transcriptional regulator
VAPPHDPSLYPSLSPGAVFDPKALFDPKTFLGQAGAGKMIGKFSKNQEIFSQGETAGAVFYIQKGRVKVTALSEHGKEAVVGILAPGQFFGEACLDGAELRTANTRAMEECLLTSITKTAMLATLDAEPEFSEFFIAHLLSRKSRIEDDLIDQLFNSSERRLARLLLLLANFGKEGSALVPVTLNQETLAEMIGTTRSRVSFFMTKFRKNGFISYNGKEIAIHSSLLDAVLREKPHIPEDE